MGNRNKPHRPPADARPESPRRPEFLTFTGEHGVELLVVANIAHVAPAETTRGRYCVAITAGAGTATYGDFTKQQVGEFLNVIYRSFHAPLRPGMGINLDALARMVQANFPESQIVQPERPALVVAEAATGP